MKKIITMFCGLTLTLACAGASFTVGAQGGVAKGPDSSVLTDAELEKEMKHELEVARHYFRMKKAYLAALNRSEYIVAGYDRFTRLDEALYLAGMSSLYLAEGKGKQKSPAAPDKLREQAREYLARLVTEFPESDFRKEADAELSRLGGATKQQENKPEAEKPKPE